MIKLNGEVFVFQLKKPWLQFTGITSMIYFDLVDLLSFLAVIHYKWAEHQEVI